jgi:putative pyoverdin transport system ATP-binding/permease protein
MHLYRLIFKISFRKFIYFTILGLIAGGANAAILILFNRHIEELVTKDQANDMYYYIVAYPLCLLLFLVFNRILSASLIAFSQSTIYNFRLDIIKFVLGSEYEKLENKREETITALTKDTDIIADSFIYLTQVSTSIITITGCFLYLAYLSFSLFLLTLTVIAVGIGLYILLSKRTNHYLKKGRDSEDFFIKHLNDILYGFKEIKVSPEKGEEIFETGVKEVAGRTRLNYTKGLIGFTDSGLLGQMVMYIFLAGLLVVVPMYFQHMQPLLINYIFILLYILRPIEVMIGVFPFISMANFSAEKIGDLKESLKQLSDGKKQPVNRQPTFERTFECLQLQNISYTHTSEENGSFTIGPIDLKISRGEAIFIYGGNGSGKTTFLKTLLGLYTPEKGTVRINEEAVGKEDHTLLQKLFSPVFSDFYLFDKLYGISEVDSEKAQRYLEIFELEKKVKIENRKFSTTKLSMGQRKRLALIASLLENKPIIVLDEWAADQDPYFRQKFYEEIVPLLKQEDRTILAVTHDDKYYHTADKLYKMEYGKLVKLQEKEKVH